METHHAKPTATESSAGAGSQPSQAIHIENLNKFYGSFRALKDVGMTVKVGEIFGFLGPNGAGKTTTIRCMLDMIRPTSGLIRVLGINPQSDPVAVHRRIGYLPGELNLDDNLTARKMLRLFDAMRGGTTDWKYAFWLAERLQLALDKPIKQFSKGNKQKVGVIQAFMHQPELLLLDEPTSGLDPLMQQKVLRLVKEANARGATVFFSSHILSEVEAVCDRVGIVRQGQIIKITETEQLTSQSFRYVNVRIHEDLSDNPLESLPGVTVLSSQEDGRVRLRASGHWDTLIKALAQYTVEEIEIEPPSLEEIFLTFYQEDGSISRTDLEPVK